ncbi:MAG TPA: hypothetical protein VEF53_19745 [Patescibacteria group bacterium]|nr:hypothetical protein [Patescibacteria group bacterium]
MIVIGTFEYSIDLELLLANLEDTHIAREHIMVVPMDIDPQNPFRFDSKKRDLRYKGTEVGMAVATGCSVIGTSAGFILAWGPVFWGLVAAAIGFFIGFGIYFFTHKPSNYRQQPNILPGIIVIVQCKDEQLRLITDAMWKYSALTVGFAP